MSVSRFCTVSSPPNPRKANENNAAPARMTNTIDVIWVVERITGRNTSAPNVRHRLTANPQTTPADRTNARVTPMSSINGRSRFRRKSKISLKMNKPAIDSAPT